MIVNPSEFLQILHNNLPKQELLSLQMEIC